MRAPHALVVVALAAVACGGRVRDRVAGQHPRSEFPAGARGGSALGHATTPAPGASARPRPPERLADVRTLARAVSRAITTDPHHVYFGDATDDGLFAVAKAGGEPVRLARRAPIRGALARDRDKLAWIGSPGDVVLQVSVAGGPTTTLRDRGLFRDLAAGGGDVLFTEAEGAGGGLMRVTGPTAARVATLEAAPHGVALGAEDAFVVAGDKLLRAPRARGPVTSLLTASGVASPIVHGDRVLVVTTTADGEHVVTAVAAAGGTSSIVARHVRAGSPLAAHAGTLYLVDDERSRLRAVDLATGADRPFAEHDAFASAAALAADAEGVFAATDEAGVVLAVGPGPG